MVGKVVRYELTHAELIKYIEYDKETGIFTRIKPKISGECGVITKSGYRKIKIGYKPHFAHRLAWLYVYGKLPELNIDHINGIKADNRIVNLRECNQQMNSINRDKGKNNKTGFKGVWYSKRSGKYYTKCTINKIKHYLGCYDTAEEAHAVYDKFSKENSGQYYKKGS
jgi:hypothetical protein